MRFPDPELADRYTDVRLDAPYPIAEAACRVVRCCFRTSRPTTRSFPISSPTGWRLASKPRRLPLYRVNGSLLGASGFAWTQPTPFDRKLEAALQAVAYLCVETVERAERYDAEHVLMVELQNKLLSELPPLAGVETAAR